MYSFTSSSKNEIKVIGLVLVVLLLCEVAIRATEPWLSFDLKHIRDIPSIAENLASGQGQRILFMGNSMTRNGIDVSVLDQELKARGATSFHIEKVHPDATGLSDWYYALKHHFVDANRHPDILVVGFAANDLQDQRPINSTRVAHFYSGVQDINEIFREDVKDFESRAEFLIADASSAFANRTRVNTRVLDALVPYYRDSSQHINRSLQASAGKPSSNRQPPTYNRLRRFLNLARANGVRVIFVAMPQRDNYGLDQQAQKIIEDSEMIFIDNRGVEGLNRESYIDEMHLNTEGATTYSRAFARQLSQHL